jgi:hypothetical protein
MVCPRVLIMWAVRPQIRMGSHFSNLMKYLFNAVIEVPEDDDLQWRHLMEEIECYLDAHTDSVKLLSGFINEIP